MGFRSSEVTWPVNKIPPFGTEVLQLCISGHCPAVRWSAVIWVVRDLVGFCAIKLPPYDVCFGSWLHSFLSTTLLQFNLRFICTVRQEHSTRERYSLCIQVLELCILSWNLWCVLKAGSSFQFLMTGCTLHLSTSVIVSRLRSYCCLAVHSCLITMYSHVDCTQVAYLVLVFRHDGRSNTNATFTANTRPLLRILCKK